MAEIATNFNLHLEKGAMTMECVATEVTDEAIALALAQANADRRFAHHNNYCVGVWTEEAGRFIGIYAKGFRSQWIDFRDIGLPLVNGKPVIADDEWIEVPGARQQGITDGITDAWTISQKPNTNGYTHDVYLGIKAKVENFDYADRRGEATLYQLNYLEGFDAVAIKLGVTGDEDYD